jgi:hypothetical protein
VIRLEQTQSSEHGTLYHPVVTFRDSHGAQQELFSSVGSFPPPYRVGDTAIVVYPSEHPEKAKLDRFFDVWGLTAIVGGVGAFWFVVGLAMLLVPVIIRRFRHAPPVLNGA